MAKRGWGKKRIEKLVPVKKTISRPGQGTFSQTFYIQPFKDKPKSGVRNKSSATDLRSKRSKTMSRDERNRMVPNDQLGPYSEIKNFKDFSKVGIDPESAKQFFCNM